MKENVNGVELHYRISGDGEKRAVLLHGWGCDLKMMEPVADALRETHRTLLIDLPGHGESGRPPEPWGVPEYAACVNQLLNRLAFLPCDIIAHSFGCRIATWMEGNHPGLFDRMVFTGAAGIRPKPSPEAQKRSARYRQLKRWCDRMTGIPPLRGAGEKAAEMLRKKYGSADYNALDEEMRRTFVKVILQDLTDLYAHFHASTLLIWGDMDTETPMWMAREMEKRIPDAGLVILEGGTHFAYLEQSQRFNLIVREFLKGDA